MKTDWIGGNSNNYRPQVKLWEGNVFTGICLSTGGWEVLTPQGGYSPHPQVGIHPHPKICGPGILRDKDDKLAARILLDCFLVLYSFITQLCDIDVDGHSA